MPVDINTWCVVIGLFLRTTQQSAVFHLTKCRNSTLYSMLLFLLLLIVFKEFSNNKDLILGPFFSLWPNGFFLETKLAIKNRHDFCISLYDSLNLNGYKLVGAENPSDLKRRDVGIILLKFLNNS